MTDDDLKRRIEDFRSRSKFAATDSVYLERRKAFAEAVGRPDLWSVIDQFGLYVGEQTLATRLAVFEIMRTCADVPGHIAEFGVWNGANLMFMAKALKLLRPNSPKKVFGFDSFEGLQDIREEDGAAAAAFAGRYRGDEATLRAAIELFGMEDWVHLVKGDALRTIPAFAEEMPHVLLSVAYIDFDLYEPCKAALGFVAERLSTGGAVVFDEAIDDVWPGEGRALREFLQDTGKAHFDMRASDFARQPTLYLVKR